MASKPEGDGKVNLIHRSNYEELCPGGKVCNGCDKGYDNVDERLGTLVNLCHDTEHGESFQKALKALEKYVGHACYDDGGPVEAAIRDTLEDKSEHELLKLFRQRTTIMRENKSKGVTGDSIRAQFQAFSPEAESSSPPKPKPEENPKEDIYANEIFSPYRDGMEVYGYFESEAARARFGCPGFVRGVKVNKYGKPC